MSRAWTESGKLRVLGKALEYSCIGPSPSESPTVVLLHEGLGSTALWRDFPKKLTQVTGFGVFVYSRAGYGYSDPADLPRPLDYMTEEAVHVLPKLLDAIGVNDGVLVGHSDGASIAAIYAGLAHDERIKRIVLIAPHFFAEDMGLSAISEARAAYKAGKLREAMRKYHSDPDNAFYGWNDSWLDPEFKRWNIESVVDGINVPILAIQGCDDQYGSLAQIDVIKNRCPQHLQTLILDNCKHSPHLEQPASVLEAISAFCQSD